MNPASLGLNLLREREREKQYFGHAAGRSRARCLFSMGGLGASITREWVGRRRGELGAGEEAELLDPVNKPVGEYPQVKSIKQLQYDMAGHTGSPPFKSRHSPRTAPTVAVPTQISCSFLCQ